MRKGSFVAGLAVLSALALCGTANAQTFYHNCWQAYADGSMDQHPSEGYSISGEGNYRFTKLYHHMTFIGFNGMSDNSNGTPPGKWQGHADDGVLMADWLADKKVFNTVVYFRNADSQVCDPTAPEGTYLNTPITVMGFRVANAGPFVDRGTDANGNLLTAGRSGCCAGYTAPLLDGGENAPPAWRMGRTPYTQVGDIGVAGPGCTPEYYMVSSVDTLHAGQEVKVGNAFFGTTGFGGFSTNSGLSGSGRFAFDWLVEKSDAMMINSTPIVEANCSGGAGGDEPRDVAKDLNFGEGWFAKKIDSCIFNAMANDPECKGLVFSSAAVSTALNTAVFGRDQGGGAYSPYLWVDATLVGDFNNDGCVDVIDLLTLVPTFGLVKGDPGFDAEVDSDCSGGVDVIDLLNMIPNFGQCLP